jgi:hypothetical protein
MKRRFGLIVVWLVMLWKIQDSVMMIRDVALHLEASMIARMRAILHSYLVRYLCAYTVGLLGVEEVCVKILSKSELCQNTHTHFTEDIFLQHLTRENNTRFFWQIEHKFLFHNLNVLFIHRYKLPSYWKA